MKGSEYTYWKFDKVIDDETCQRILDLGKNKFEDALVGKKKFKNNKNIRDSSIVWLNEKWLFDLIFPYMYSANENSGWNVDVDASEDMQLTQYKKKGFYNYHKDGAGFNLHNKPYSKNLHNKTRKLSMTMLLNDDFDGGKFQFYNQPAFEMQKGDIIFFPSFELHRVLPINEGVRHSLVAWFVGPKYK